MTKTAGVRGDIGDAAVLPDMYVAEKSSLNNGEYFSLKKDSEIGVFVGVETSSSSGSLKSIANSLNVVIEMAVQESKKGIILIVNNGMLEPEIAFSHYAVNFDKSILVMRLGEFYKAMARDFVIYVDGLEDKKRSPFGGYFYKPIDSLIYHINNSVILSDRN